MSRKGDTDATYGKNQGKCAHTTSFDNSGDDDKDQLEDSSATNAEAEEKKFPQHKFESTKDDRDTLTSLIKKLALPSFVHAGIQRKAPFTALEYWIALSLTLDGRDKITKLLQYVSRFLGWWFLSKMRTDRSCLGHGRRFTSLYKSLGKSRKAFRLGRSINEIHKISSLGFAGLFYWHLKHQYIEDNCERQGDIEISEGCTREDDNKLESRSPSGNSFQIFRAGSQPNFNNFSQRVLNILSSTFGTISPSDDALRVKWWKLIGTTLKTIGMLGYWLGDNANFLTSSGVLDNYNLSEKDRLARRKRWQDITGKKTNQFYFFATIVGLFSNAFAYHRFQLKNAFLPSQHEPTENGSNPKPNVIERKRNEEEQFVLSLALLKNCMDVIVFSNNPGIDLHKKWRGRKNHEAIHCFCGLVSACVSLYNNFPDAKV